MNKVLFFIMMFLLNSILLFSQVAVNTDGSAPNPSAILDLKSANKGFLLPRMTLAEIYAIATPAEGLMVYCTDNYPYSGTVAIYRSGQWWECPMTVLEPASPIAGTHIPSPTQIVWNWNPVNGAVWYLWGTTNEWQSATDMHQATTKTETGLTCNTNYTRYVWAQNWSNYPSPPTVLTQSTSLDPPAAPVSGTHVPSKTQIVWNWDAVTGATGYKWNPTDDYENAEDMGTNTSKTETGLNCNIEYTRFVWAYNFCGNSTSVTLSQSTSACWVCSDSITKYHVAGNVAPVTKTVTYGTVTNIPGETSKCWITSNLGADHQATAVNDATEASAGWYWQFNRMQGYKHDGTIRTPNTTWIYPISENSDWLSANDPCALLLGSGWRLPTLTEWTNVDASGGWTNWNGPWSSALKIHAAGYLVYNDGSINYRGSWGYYWSSSQTDNANCWDLHFYNTYCDLNSNGKTTGFSSRCLRE
jgi:hypothetical protein